MVNFLICLPKLHRKAIFPIQMELGEEDEKHGSSESEDEEENDDLKMENYIHKMTSFRDVLYKGAKRNIVNAQFKQKIDYNRKHGKAKVPIENYHTQICKPTAVL